jgi:hypothetical protein
MSEDEQKMPLSESLEVIRRSWDAKEDMGYDAPFSTFTWKRWLEMQAQVMQSFTRFQRAIEQRQPLLALTVALELQMILAEMQTEACIWIEVEEMTVKRA